MWMSVNFNEIAWTICLLTDSNKEIYKYLLFGLDIPAFDFNAQETTTEKLFWNSKEINKTFDESYFNDYGLQPASMSLFIVQNSFSVHQVLIGTLILWLILKITSLLCKKPFLKKTWNCLFYFNFFNFPIWYAFQSCLTLFLVSMKTLIDYDYLHSKMGKLNIAFSIIYLLLMVIAWIFVLIKICRKKKETRCNSFTEFTVGLKKSKVRTFLVNFHFVFLRLSISVMVVFFQEFIKSWKILPFFWTFMILM